MRAADGENLLAGYVNGPAAATEATVVALARAEGARAVVLVEGVRDQIAVETLARRHGRDLAAEGVVVLPTGGAHGAGRYLRRFGPEGTGATLAGLCDAGEARRGLAAQAPLRPSADRGDQPRPDTAAALRPARRRLTPSADVFGQRSAHPPSPAGLLTA
jgi:hypothetical protein